MRRFGRWLWNAAAALSLLVCLLLAAILATDLRHGWRAWPSASLLTAEWDGDLYLDSDLPPGLYPPMPTGGRLDVLVWRRAGLRFRRQPLDGTWRVQIPLAWLA